MYTAYPNKLESLLQAQNREKHSELKSKMHVDKMNQFKHTATKNITYIASEYLFFFFLNMIFKNLDSQT